MFNRLCTLCSPCDATVRGLARACVARALRGHSRPPLPLSLHAQVSFTIDASFVNPGPNYLSAGDMPLPVIYGIFTVAFACALGVWIWHGRRNSSDKSRIHGLMTALLVVKVRVGGGPGGVEEGCPSLGANDVKTSIMLT